MGTVFVLFPFRNGRFVFRCQCLAVVGSIMEKTRRLKGLACLLRSESGQPYGASLGPNGIGDWDLKDRDTYIYIHTVQHNLYVGGRKGWAMWGKIIYVCTSVPT